MSVVAHENFKLNRTPIITTTRSTEDECIEDCIGETKCFSINVVIVSLEVTCELLKHDRFRERESFVPDVGTKHLSIEVSI